jgi:hypothetical protein
MIRNVSSRFARFIEIIEKDVVTLAVFYLQFCNVFEGLRMMTDNSYPSQFADLVDRQFSKTADRTLAELAHVFTPDGFRWLASR